MPTPASSIGIKASLLKQNGASFDPIDLYGDQLIDGGPSVSAKLPAYKPGPRFGGAHGSTASFLARWLKPRLQVIREERPKTRVGLDEPRNISQILDPLALPPLGVSPSSHLALERVFQ